MKFLSSVVSAACLLPRTSLAQTDNVIRNPTDNAGNSNQQVFLGVGAGANVAGPFAGQNDNTFVGFKAGRKQGRGQTPTMSTNSRPPATHF